MKKKKKYILQSDNVIETSGGIVEYCGLLFI